MNGNGDVYLSYDKFMYRYDAEGKLKDARPLPPDFGRPFCVDDDGNFYAAIHVALCYFLVKKLRGYAERLGLGGVQAWAVLDARYTVLAERAKLSDSDLNGLAAVARRVVTENTVFRFDGGEAAFAAAEKAVDPAERAALLAAGVIQLIDGRRY